MSQKYSNLLAGRRCLECSGYNHCFLRRIPLTNYPEMIQSFVIYPPQDSFKYEYDGWHADHKKISEGLMQYYNSHMSNTGGAYCFFSGGIGFDEEMSKKVRDSFKSLLEAAAKSTKYQNPELSIIFDGIGLILAEDYLEVVKKIFSIIDTMKQQKQEHLVV